MTRHPLGRSALAAVVLAWPVLAATAVQAADVPAARNQANVASPTVASAAVPADWPPSIHFEQAEAHAADQIDFEPGERVTVGFMPRAGDGWSVGGRAPLALPAGTATGREILAGREPSDPAGLPEARPAAMKLPGEAASIAPTGTGLHREVFGFLPYWELSDSSTTLHYDRLSTIAYFGVGADRDGNLIKKNSAGVTTSGWSGWASSRLTNVINAAHGQGTRVVLTIQCFGWTANQASTQAALLGDPNARLNLARQAAAAVRDRGADGINLDFEPIVSGFADEFTALVRTMRAELDAIGPGYQLTFDTTGWIGNYPIAEATAPGGADAIFIMGYDYRNGSASTAGSISPLTGPVYDLSETIAAYTARVPASKLILGVPWYGRAWSTATDAVRSPNISSSTNGSSVSVMYPTAVDLAAQEGRRFDGAEQTPWTAYRRTTCNPGCVTTWRQLYYDDVESLARKYDFINRSGIRGVGIWALGFDDNRPELQALLAQKFQHDTTPPQAGVRALPATMPTREVPVLWVGLDDRGISHYDVDVAVDGGPWLRWLTATAATSGNYAGAPGRGFAFRARATDTAGNAGPWIDTRWAADPSLAIGGFARVAATNVNLRTAPTTSASIAGTAASGQLLAITGGPVSADGYQWFEVSLPIEEWGALDPITTGVWIAAGTAGEPFIVPAQAPNATSVDSRAASPAGARYVGVGPVRLLDSRVGNGLTGAFRSGTPRGFQVAGRGGVPANAIAVTGNLTITESTSSGWITIGPTAGSTAATSSLNAPRGDDRAAGLTVALGDGGSLAAVFQGAPGASAHIVLDISGYYAAGSDGATFVALEPARILDSRFGNGLSGQFSSHVPRTFEVSGRGGVPGDSVAVTANVTITGQTSAGYLAVGPAVDATPETSILNAPRGDNRANGVTVPLAPDGTLRAVWIGSGGSKVDVIVDVTGYFAADGRGATYHPIVPVRLLDSRSGNGLSAAFQQRSPRSVLAAGRGTIPIDAVAVTGTLTITGQSSGGYLGLGPTMSNDPPTSALNAPRGDDRANGVTVRFGPSGSLGLVWVGAINSSANVVLDATGYFR